jgi:hypothetical protein
VGDYLLTMATHLDQSNYLASQKQGAVNKLLDSSRAPPPGMYVFSFRVAKIFPVDSLDLTDKPHQEFSVQRIKKLSSRISSANSSNKLSNYNLNKRITNTLALPMNKMTYIYLLCPHSEHPKNPVPI